MCNGVNQFYLFFLLQNASFLVFMMILFTTNAVFTGKSHKSKQEYALVRIGKRAIVNCLNQSNKNHIYVPKYKWLLSFRYRYQHIKVSILINLLIINLKKSRRKKVVLYFCSDISSYTTLIFIFHIAFNHSITTLS